MEKSRRRKTGFRTSVRELCGGRISSAQRRSWLRFFSQLGCGWRLVRLTVPTQESMVDALVSRGLVKGTKIGRMRYVLALTQGGIDLRDAWIVRNVVSRYNKDKRGR